MTEDKSNTITPLWNGERMEVIGEPAISAILRPEIVSQQDAMSCIEYILDHEGEDYYEQEPEDRRYHIYKCALDALGLKEYQKEGEEK